MNVKPLHVVLGALALCAAALLFDWSLRHWTRKGLAFEMTADPPLALHAGDAVEGKLRSVPKETTLTIDGQTVPLAIDRSDGLKLPLEKLGPGLHVARLEVGSRSTTSDGVRLWERSIEVGAMEGPFEAASSWHSCAVELHVRQALLDDFLSPELVRQLSKLKDLRMAPAVASATAAFKWEGDGIDGTIHVHFVSGTDLDVHGHLRISVTADHELRLELPKALDVSGSQVAAWHGLFKVRLLVAADAVLGGLSGEGFANGAQRGLAAVDAKIRDKLTSLVEEKILRVDQLLRLPGSLAFEGTNLRYRYCRNIDIAAGRSGTVGFDVEEQVARHEPAATFGIPDMPPSPDPGLTEQGGNVAVDFSPGLLNGLLDGAWRSGQIAQLMNQPRWLDRINENHSRTQFDFKVRRVEPLLPPFLDLAGGEAELRMAETRLILTAQEEDRERDARLFADVRVRPRFDSGRDEFVLDAALTDLAATCHDPEEQSGGKLLRPCYADLLRAIDDKHLETSEESPTHPFAVSLHHVLEALPFKLSRIHPAVVESRGQPWFRVTAEMAPVAPASPPASGSGSASAGTQKSRH